MPGNEAIEGVWARDTGCRRSEQYQLEQPSAGEWKTCQDIVFCHLYLRTRQRGIEWKEQVKTHQENVRRKEKCKSWREAPTHSSPPIIRKEMISAQKGRREIIDLGNSYQAYGGKHEICPVAELWKLLETELIVDFLVCLRKWEGICPLGAYIFSNFPCSGKNSFFEQCNFLLWFLNSTHTHTQKRIID